MLDLDHTLVCEMCCTGKTNPTQRRLKIALLLMFSYRLVEVFHVFVFFFLIALRLFLLSLNAITITMKCTHVFMWSYFNFFLYDDFYVFLVNSHNYMNVD